MAFNLRRFLAHVSPGVLEEHLRRERSEIADAIDWAAPETDVRTAVLAAITQQEGDSIVLAFERVHHMADEAGERAMIAVGATADARVTFASVQDRALDLLGRDERLFDRAEETRQADWLAGSDRMWTGYVGPRDRCPELGGGRLERFRERLEAAFRQFDGSGSKIAVEPFERDTTNRTRHGGGRVFQLAVYLEALPQILTEFDGPALVRRGTRPARELVLTYAPTTGSIDVVAHAGRPLREQAAKAFADELFPSNAELQPVRLRQYNLASLLEPRRFPTAPEDGIEAVRLTLVRLAPGGRYGRITLELGKDAPWTLHEAAQEWFGARTPFHWAASVTKARLSIQFRLRAGQRRGRTLSVELTYPNGCNLRDRCEEERIIGERYLARWGLVQDV